jgi:hypothetical protein
VKVSSSQPPSSKSLDAGWGLFSDEPAPPEEDDDTRTVQMSSPLFKDPPSIEEIEGTSDERDTMPPPVPVAEYVQTMMQQASEDAEPPSRPISSPFSWQSSMPPSSRSGTASERGRTAAQMRRLESWRTPIPPPPPVDNADDDDDELGGFTLVAFEPERLGDTPAEREAARYGHEPAPTPVPVSGFDELPFDDVIAASERSSVVPHMPTPVPVYPSSLPPASSIPSSRGEPRPAPPPPLFDDPWRSETLAPEPEEFELPAASPPTKRGLAAPSAPARAYPGTQRYGSIGDASVQPRPSTAPRAPITVPRPPPPVDPFDDVRELYDAGDFRSALVMAEALLETEPEHAEARACAASCRETLAKKYLSRLGGLAKILRVAMPPDEIRWLSLDHKAGFLLSCIDGTSTIEEVLDVACMHEFEAIRILHDFRELGVIEILPDPRSSRR